MLKFLTKIFKQRVSAVKKLNDPNSDVWTVGDYEIMGFENEPTQFVYSENKVSFFSIYKIDSVLTLDVLVNGKRKFYAKTVLLENVPAEEYESWLKSFYRLPYV
jgi:hypothetical protein